MNRDCEPVKTLTINSTCIWNLDILCYYNIIIISPKFWRDGHLLPFNQFSQEFCDDWDICLFYRRQDWTFLNAKNLCYAQL